MLLKLAVSAVAIIAVLLVAIARRPNSFRIYRTTTVAAPADVIFRYLNDLHAWSRWNPFERQDPNMTMTYSGPAAGAGASYHYVSKTAGEGRMTIIESTPNERVAVRAEFIKPFTATNRIDLTLEPTTSGVSITWAMSGPQPFLGKAISMFMSMERMVGSQFEKGLADLKRLAEDDARGVADARTLAPAPRGAASRNASAS
jgi:hypothetical protein